ncbi:hypothetical protein [Deinococcus budaensis]|uniref:Uncharacterized protein n=1 Tax=Deinococcus budaensis TaxID=1665626 RepID=A0A7W8GI84_9DEIO|nr:hypothetical protein [Deinococcus budaensis]MBB5236124.1 hypothetical protein [Deinococcus budaensis]
MNDRELDDLFAQAREETPADAGAADRFLSRWRAGAVPPTPAPRPRLARGQPTRGWPALLACAAVLTGALVLRPPAAPALPASAAYDAYQGALGEGW